MQTASSARRTCFKSRSASEWTATVLIHLILYKREECVVQFLHGWQLQFYRTSVIPSFRVYSIMNKGWSYSTGCAFSTMICLNNTAFI